MRVWLQASVLMGLHFRHSVERVKAPPALLLPSTTRVYGVIALATNVTVSLVLPDSSDWPSHLDAATHMLPSSTMRSRSVVRLLSVTLTVFDSYIMNA